MKGHLEPLVSMCVVGWCDKIVSVAGWVYIQMSEQPPTNYFMMIPWVSSLYALS